MSTTVIEAELVTAPSGARGILSEDKISDRKKRWQQRLDATAAIFHNASRRVKRAFTYENVGRALGIIASIVWYAAVFIASYIFSAWLLTIHPMLYVLFLAVLIGFLYASIFSG